MRKAIRSCNVIRKLIIYNRNNNLVKSISWMDNNRIRSFSLSSSMVDDGRSSSIMNEVEIEIGKVLVLIKYTCSILLYI